MSINFYDFKKNVYSQHGEDGIIEKLLSVLKVDNGYYVEFGAHDGMLWSNTYRLYEQGWKGCLIEADGDRFQKLCKNIPDEEILKIKSMVTGDGATSLDNILLDNAISDVDVLSIDIDSDDLSVWEGVKNFEPAIVIIEYNSVIPFDTRYINTPGTSRGNSALSIKESASDRGYTLVEGTDTNLIFVKSILIPGTEIEAKSLQAIRDQTYQLRYFFGYDGTLLHDFKLLNDGGITEFYPITWGATFGRQPIPRIFRKTQYRVNFPALSVFAFVSIFRHPFQLIKLGTLTVKILLRDRSIFEFLTLLLNKEKLVATLKKEQL